MVNEPRLGKGIENSLCPPKIIFFLINSDFLLFPDFFQHIIHKIEIIYKEEKYFKIL